MMFETIAPNRRILLIDDNESIHQDFRKILNPATPGKASLASAVAELFGRAAAGAAEAKYEIDSAFQGQEGLEKVRQACAEQRPYAMAFVDVRMPPGWDGIETISRIWAEYADLQVVICTAYSDYSLDQMAGRLGRTDRMLILKKPFDAIEVLQFADSLTEKWRLSQEARAKMDDLEERVAARTRELREGQQQLIEARKMELVGKLAGGIAHDFNSLLTAIIGHAELIQQAAADESLPFQSAGEISKAATSAATLTRQLLAFSRKQRLRPELLDVNAAVIGMGLTLRGLMGDGIEVSTKANARNPWTRADAGQIQQVLISLAHNARDAMAHGGKLCLETADVTLAAEDASSGDDVHPGDYVVIAVTDTGGGIPEEVKPHLFEPYFTTKAQGEGKGMGLAMCHGILKQSGGHIAVESTSGRGTTFKLYLPRIEEGRSEGTLAPPVAGAASSPAVHVTGVVLLVEADETLRAMAGTVLENAGYTVRRAASSREAINIAGRLTRVDLLLADAVMPEMTGKELGVWLCASRPHMKVLFTSAVDDDKSAQQGDSGADILRKPYTPGILAERVRSALGEGARQTEEKIAAS